MILTFNYSEQGVTDSRPILLFLNNNKKNKNLDGLNLNYLNPTKLKKLFQVTDFKKTEIDEVENLLSLKEIHPVPRTTGAPTVSGFLLRPNHSYPNCNLLQLPE